MQSISSTTASTCFKALLPIDQNTIVFVLHHFGAAPISTVTPLGPILKLIDNQAPGELLRYIYVLSLNSHDNAFHSHPPTYSPKLATTTRSAKMLLKITSQQILFNSVHLVTKCLTIASEFDFN